MQGRADQEEEEAYGPSEMDAHGGKAAGPEAACGLIADASSTQIAGHHQQDVRYDRSGQRRPRQCTADAGQHER